MVLIHRARRGRPPLPSSARRDQRVSVRFTPTEMKLIREVAKLSGKELSEWLLDRALRYSRRKANAMGLVAA